MCVDNFDHPHFIFRSVILAIYSVYVFCAFTKKGFGEKKSDVVNCEKTGVVVSKVNFTLVWR